MEATLKGFTDKAAVKDLFAIEKYVSGLSAFIQNCNTPMTISIQGTWGTGKTSLMQIVQAKLKEENRSQCIWFNTWQFSQFNMDNELAISLLSCLIEELNLSAKKKEEVTRTTQAIRIAQAVGMLGKEAFLAYVDSKVGGRVADGAEEILNKAKAKYEGQETIWDSAKAIKELKKQFESCVKETLENEGKERIVVFIDDLDRLEPRKAVELLEVLKLFLDCENCVFVLAIDYAVVCRGVEAKYGKLADDEKEHKEKGKSFFDKIIQVPFKLPVAEYDISGYVSGCFEEIGIPCPEGERDIYVNLIKNSCGTNPRSMKRLFNTYLLLSIVVNQEILEKDENKQMLFAVLCLQYSFEKVYEYIIRNIQKINAESLDLLASGDAQQINKNQAFEDLDLSEDDAARLKGFMTCFIDVIDKNEPKGKITDDEIINLKNVLGVSTITAAGDEEASATKDVVAKSIDEFECGKDPEEVESIINLITGIGEGITYTLRNTKYPHVLFKIANNKTLADIYMRKEGFAVDCYPKNVEALKEDESISSIRTHNGKLIAENDFKYKCVTLNVKDEISENNLLKVLQVCYDSFRER